MLEQLRLLPVVALEDASLAARLGDALIAGKLPCAEITFRTDAAEQAIATLARDERLLVGAGTVLTTDQVDRAVDAGARFIVSPGFDAAVVRHCQHRNVAVIPGVATPTEIQMALGEGLDMLKFFPAEANGGLATLAAISPAFPAVRFVPTGGIGPHNVAAYLAHPAVAAVGGSWMVATQLLREKNFSAVARLAAEAVALTRTTVRSSP